MVVSSSRLNITSTIFLENNGGLFGGAMYVTAKSNLQVRASSMEYNYATENGGAIYAANINATLISTNISNNIAESATGGGLYIIDRASFTIRSLNCFNNSAGERGGCMYVESAATNVESSNISYNKAWNGGGMHMSLAASIVMSNTIFSFNEATVDGGALHLTNSS